MAVYPIGYDLIKRKDYPELYEAINGLADDYWHCLDSTWIVVSKMSHGEVRVELRLHIDADDKLIVVTLQKGAAWTISFPSNCQEWLKRYL